MLQVHRQPVLVGGRYLKLKRGVSQSPWLVNGGQAVTEASVEVRNVNHSEATHVKGHAETKFSNKSEQSTLIKLRDNAILTVYPDISCQSVWKRKCGHR